MYEIYGCYERGNSNIELEDDQKEKKMSLLFKGLMVQPKY
jgi:hypothetical protein